MESGNIPVPFLHISPTAGFNRVFVSGFAIPDNVICGPCRRQFPDTPVGVFKTRRRSTPHHALGLHLKDVQGETRKSGTSITAVLGYSHFHSLHFGSVHFRPFLSGSAASSAVCFRLIALP
jgi:hypothetical protein